MDKRYSIIIKDLKVLVGPDGKELYRSRNFKELVSRIPKETSVVDLIFKYYFRKKELVIPNIDFKDIERIIAWKINEMFRTDINDILYSYDLDNGPYVNKLFVVFIKAYYLKRIRSLLQESNISIVGVFVSTGDKLIQFNDPTKNTISFLTLKWFVLIVGLIILTVMNLFYYYKSYNYSKSESVKTNNTNISKSNTSINAEPAISFTKAYDKLIPLFSNAANRKLHLKSLDYCVEQNMVELKGWFVDSTLIDKDIKILKLKPRGNYYEFTGEASVK